MNAGGSNKGPVAFYAMVARPRELLRELREGKDTVKALKAIKNQVIGSKIKKAAFIGEGAVEQVLEVLKACSKATGDRQELVEQQAAVVIGSLTYGTEAGLRELITHQGMPFLVGMLHSSDPAVVEAGLRAIKMVMQQVTPIPSYLSDAGPGADNAAVAAAATATATAGAIQLDATAVTAVVQCLVQQTSQETDHGGLLPITATTAGPTPASAPVVTSVGPSGRNSSLAALAAAVVACCCRREQECTLAISAGAPAGLLQLLVRSSRADIQVAALEGLSLMLPHHPPSCTLALARPGVYGILQALLRDPAPAVRLLSASCVATLSRTPGCEQSEAMQRAALPVLLRLLVQPATRPHVPAVLARLIEGSEPLQKAAADADTVRLLAGLLAAEAAPPPPASSAASAAVTGTALTKAAAAATVPGAAATAAAADCAPPSSAGIPSAAFATSAAASSLREGCLRALGSLCLNRDDSRQQLLEAKVLRHIMRSLEDPSEGVRSAAALCVRALSRCVRTLRGGLLDGGGELAPVLVGLLQDPNVDVQTSAAAALANLVLDFSSAKAGVLAAGGLPRLAALALPSTTITATGSSGGESSSQLRHHATWALANLTYRSDSGVRNQLMQALPWPQFRQLLYDADPGVVEQALVMLRNLSMGDRLRVRATLEWAGCGPLLRRHQQGQPHPYQQGIPGAGQVQQQQDTDQRGSGNAADLAVLLSQSDGGGSGGGGGDASLLSVLQEFIEAAGEAVAVAAAIPQEVEWEEVEWEEVEPEYIGEDPEDVLQGSEAEEDGEDDGDQEEDEEEEEEEHADTEMGVAAPESGATQGPTEPVAAPPSSSHAAAARASTVADAVVEAIAAALASSQPQPQPQHRRRYAPQHAMTHGSHALYAVVNLLTGGGDVKDAVAARRPLLAAVAANLRSEAAADLALPAVWCAINLAWPPSPSLGSAGAGSGTGGGEGRAEVEAGAVRCRVLLDLGAAERLEQLQRSHPSRDVQERAKTALEQLRRAAAAAAAAAASGAAGSAGAAVH